MSYTETQEHRVDACTIELSYARLTLFNGVATRTDFLVRGSDRGLLAGRQKTLSEEIGKNEHAHFVRFPRKARRRRTTPRTRKSMRVATA